MDRRFWTIQPLEVWQTLQRTGEVRVDPTNYHHQHVPERYLWLVDQLRQRCPGYTGLLPWWAYCEKPDLRTHRHRAALFDRIQQQVRLELEPDPSEVTIFPIWAWDTVYCGGYLALTLSAKENWEERWEAHPELEDLWPRPSPWREELEASWQLLFSPELPQLCPWRGREYSMFERSVNSEAVVEILKFSAVRRAEVFTQVSRGIRSPGG